MDRHIYQPVSPPSQIHQPVIDSRTDMNSLSQISNTSSRISGDERFLAQYERSEFTTVVFVGRTWGPPTFAASNRRPAVRRAGIEIRNWWRGRIVSLGSIGSVRVRGPRRVLLRVAEIVVHPLLMLSGLSPRQIAGKGGFG